MSNVLNVDVLKPGPWNMAVFGDRGKLKGDH